MVWLAGTSGKGVYYFDGDGDVDLLMLMLVVWPLWWLKYIDMQ